MQYRPEIDGLRAIAVLPVIFFHAGFSWFSGGYVGVDVFFVISGYLITSIIIEEIVKDDFSVVRFYERRARRILPALFFVLLFCVPFALAWMTESEFDVFAKSFFAIALFASNIFFWKEENYFSPPAEENPLLHTWSLAVEEQFYIFFPLLLLSLWRYGLGRLFGAILFMSLGSLFLAELGWRNFPGANFYLLPTRAWELGLGALCALLLRGREIKSSACLSVTGLLLILSSVFLFDNVTPFPSVATLVPVLGAGLIILFAKDNCVARLLSSKLLVAIGLLSYSAYLWHQPIFAFSRLRGFYDGSFVVISFLVFLVFLFAYISWRFIERPFRNKKFISTSRGAMGLSFVFFFSLIFFAGSAMGGLYDWRFSKDQVRWISEIESLKESRKKLIRAGTCQYNGIEQSLSDFLNQWDCKGNQSGAAVGLYGDSHSADKALVLRSAGVDFMQIGGAHCPLLPGDTRNPYCNKILERFLSEAGHNMTDTVLLANRYDEKELTSEVLSRVFSFWGDRFDNVVFFSPMPEFPRLDSVYSLHGLDVMGIDVDLSAHYKFFGLVSNMDIPDNVSIYNTASLFCGLDDLGNCKPIQEGGAYVDGLWPFNTVCRHAFGEPLFC